MTDTHAKIMVVDDDMALRVTLMDILEDEGFDVVGVSDGYEAVKMATAEHFSLIFMDVRMPGIDGVEANRRIKEISPDLVVVMVTAFAGQGLIEQALQEGAYAVLYKPFDFRQLTEIVQTVMKTTCVLVVDDQADSRETVRMILEDQGYQVSEAANGKQAVTKAGKKHYEIILMDAVMPEKDGFTACEKVIETDPDAKVIFLTAHSLVSWVRQALAAGAFSLLSKPVEPADMITLMKSVVESPENKQKNATVELKSD
jgi:CheY-like chemotaxis protein